MKRPALLIALLFALTACAPAASGHAPPAPYAVSVAEELTAALGVPVAYKQSGPQSIFYVQTLPPDADAELARVLSPRRDKIPPGGAIVVLGLEPEAAFWATPTVSSQRLTNTTMVGTFASMVDGRERITPSGAAYYPAAPSGVNCTSRTSASGSLMRCSGPSGYSYESRCTWYGDELVCRSRSD